MKVVYLVSYYDEKLSHKGHGTQCRSFVERPEAEKFAEGRKLYGEPAKVVSKLVPETEIEALHIWEIRLKDEIEKLVEQSFMRKTKPAQDRAFGIAAGMQIAVPLFPKFETFEAKGAWFRVNSETFTGEGFKRAREMFEVHRRDWERQNRGEVSGK